MFLICPKRLCFKHIFKTLLLSAYVLYDAAPFALLLMYDREFHIWYIYLNIPKTTRAINLTGCVKSI